MHPLCPTIAVTHYVTRLLSPIMSHYCCHPLCPTIAVTHYVPLLLSPIMSYGSCHPVCPTVAAPTVAAHPLCPTVTVTHDVSRSLSPIMSHGCLSHSSGRCGQGPGAVLPTVPAGRGGRPAALRPLLQLLPGLPGLDRPALPVRVPLPVSLQPSHHAVRLLHQRHPQRGLRQEQAAVAPM